MYFNTVLKIHKKKMGSIYYALYNIMKQFKKQMQCMKGTDQVGKPRLDPHVLLSSRQNRNSSKANITTHAKDYNGDYSTNIELLSLL